MNNILYPTNTRFIKNVGKNLNNKKNKIFFYGHPKNNKEIKKYYNSEKVIQEVLYSQKKNEFQNKLIIRDKKKYEYYKNTFNQFSKRIYINKNIEKQKDFFFEICSFHYDYIKQNKISHLVYWATPHFHFGFSLYYVADILNLKQFILHETDIENTFIIRKNWFSHHKYILNTSIKKSLIDLKKDQKSEKSKIIRSLAHKDLYDSKLFPLNVFYFILKKIIRILLIINNNDKDAYFFYSEKNFKIYEAYLKLKMIVNKLLTNYFYKYYISQKKVNFNEKFIYFALHVEPERTSLPEGGIFNDQIKAIKLLRKSVPHDIKIFIKEHPNQFWLKDSCIDTLFFKGINFYKKIKKIKNVQILKLNTNPDDLISKSICTATITGTSGWEALKLGKKAIVFGYPWYSDNKNCLCIDNESKITQNKIYKFILKKNVKDMNYMKKYTYNYNKYLVEAETWEGFLKKPKNIKLITKIFAKKIERLF